MRVLWDRARRRRAPTIAALRGFGLGLESGRHGVPPPPKLRPDGWDCHFPADVKDHAPQDVTLRTQLLYQKTAHG